MQAQVHNFVLDEETDLRTPPGRTESDYLCFFYQSYWSLKIAQFFPAFCIQYDKRTHTYSWSHDVAKTSGEPKIGPWMEYFFEYSILQRTLSDLFQRKHIYQRVCYNFRLSALLTIKSGYTLHMKATNF